MSDYYHTLVLGPEAYGVVGIAVTRGYFWRGQWRRMPAKVRVWKTATGIVTQLIKEHP